MQIDIDRDVVEKFVNECTFVGPNAEAVRDAMIQGLERDDQAREFHRHNVKPIKDTSDFERMLDHNPERTS